MLQMVDDLVGVIEGNIPQTLKYTQFQLIVEILTIQTHQQRSHNLLHISFKRLGTTLRHLRNIVQTNFKHIFFSHFFKSRLQIREEFGQKGGELFPRDKSQCSDDCDPVIMDVLLSFEVFYNQIVESLDDRRVL